jgi:hypothetical protein
VHFWQVVNLQDWPSANAYEHDAACRRGVRPHGRLNLDIRRYVTDRIGRYADNARAEL